MKRKLKSKGMKARKENRTKNVLEVLYVFAIIVSLLVISLTSVESRAEVLTAPINLILEPDYQAKKEKSKVTDETEIKPDEKLQYEPVSEDDPLLEERESPEEVKDGATYKTGRELYVAPNPSHQRKIEVIEEASAADLAVLPIDGPYPVEVESPKATQ